MAYSYEDLLALYNGQGAPGQGTPGPMAPADAYGVEGTTEPSVVPFAQPGESGGYLEPPTMPGIMGPGGGVAGSPEGASTSVGMKVGAGQSAGMSQSYSGTSRARQDHRDAPLNKAYAASDTAVSTAYAPVAGAIESSRDSSKDAAKAIEEADLKKAELQKQGAERLAGFNNDLANQEIEITAKYAARENQRISDYEQSLADFAAQKVNPTELWDNMSGGMRFGTMVTAFVHDFLGAKGIKTSAMQTLNTAVDRNINAQIQNIGKKRDVAAGFKSLWEMERAKSGSDAEARARVKTYMLEAVKQGIVADMSKYDSMMASAVGKKALAEADAAYAKSYGDVIKHIEQDSANRRQQDLTWASNKMRADAENYSTSVRAAANRLDELKYNDKQKADAAAKQAAFKDNVLIDPETGIGKQVLKGERSPTEIAAVRNAVTETANLNRGMKELRELANRTDTKAIDEFGVSRLSTEAKRKYDAIRYKIAHAAVKANNERATKEDVQEYLKSMPIDTMLTNGGIDEILSYTQKTSLNAANDLIQQHTWDLPQDRWVKGAEGRIFEGSEKEAALSEKQAKRGGVQDQITDIATKAISRPDNSDKAHKSLLDKVGLDDTSAELDYRSGGDAFPVMKETERERDAGMAGTFGTADRKAHRAPAWAVGITALGEAARKDDKAAIAALTKMAGIDRAGGGDSLFGEMDADTIPKARAFATYQLMKLKRSAPPSGKQAPAQPGISDYDPNYGLK